MSERPEVRVGSNGEALVPAYAGARRFRPEALSWATLATVAAAIVVVDRVTKDAISDRLIYGSDHRLLGPLSLTHTSNSGIAFGLFATRTGLVALVGLAVVAAMLTFFARVGGDDRRLGPAFGLLVGGSLGNLLDRLRFGRVTDFIEMRFWPAFNFADVFIVAGVVILLLVLFKSDRQTAQSLLNPLEAR